MSKTVVIKRFGNAKAIILPEKVMDELELERGSKMSVSIEDGNILLTPIREKNVTLDSLLNPLGVKKKGQL